MTGNGNKLKQFVVQFRSVGTLAILAILFVGAAIATPEHTFVGTANINNLLSIGAEFGIIALGVGVLMIAGEFDLSVGSVLAFCSFLFTWFYGLVGSIYVAVLLTLICGALIGTLHGLITVKGHIVSFIATLGAMLSWRGLTEILSGGKIRSLAFEPDSLFAQLFSARLGDILPIQFVWFILFAAILYLALNRGRFGNWIYATGDNPMAARAMAVDTHLVKIVCFAIVGFLCAFSSVIQTARVTAFSTHMGTGWELQAVAAAVVGGVSLRGGRGSMIGIFVGALIIIVIDNMIGQLRLAYEWTYMAFGIVILGAALLDLIIEKRIQRASA